MKAVFVWALILGFGGLAVMAVAFRSRQARDMLKFGRNAIWLYIAFIFLLALIQLYRREF
ncbi:MAG: hypothetical protein C0506_04400 [Anaerolinea sp.]|nr:hypothetical protein [Anaerolinea sp.]